MSIDFSKTAATSRASGFQNYAPKDFSASIPAQTLAFDGYATSIATTTLDNIDAVSQVQARMPGFDDNWRVLTGCFNSFLVPSAPPDYLIEVYIYRTGDTLSVLTFVVNQSGGSVNIPQITTECRAYLFIPPFDF